MVDEEMKMTNAELAKAIRHGLFADRDNLKEAFDYAFSVFRTLGPNEIAATTAMFVVLNTLAKELVKVEE
jgi:hypothetical protein